MTTRIEGWFDGAVEPVNPGGHGAYGALVKVDGVIVWSESRYIGHGPTISNNVAEYSGATACMQQILALPVFQCFECAVVLRGDSMLVIKQLSGEWKVKRGLYVPYYRQAILLRAKIPSMRLEWIPRNLNHEADVLSKKQLIDRNVEFRLQKEA